MENPLKFQSVEPSRDSRRRYSYPGSPEFEFWMVRNPSMPQPHLPSADELFVDGVLLPLDLVSASAPAIELVSASAAPAIEIESTSSGFNPPTVSNPEQDLDTVTDLDVSGLEITASVSASEPVSGSRRWTDIFKKSESKQTKEAEQQPETVKEKKKRETKSSVGGGHSGSSSAELNINIWPFSRSRSAGNNMTRPRLSTGSRKVSSAPCSRSNSGGESKLRKWPASPGRAGVHVGRSSPVWQVRRAAVPKSESRKCVIPGENSGSEKAKIISLNGSMRIGCKMSAAVGGGEAGGSGHSRKGSGGSNEGSGVASPFSLRGWFSKKVY